jgi:methylenetetrahydrofolate--tRNA-(uracil-5-)-methyltransferase
LLPPPTTAHGGLLTQLSRNPGAYQPSNITFSHVAPLEGVRLKKRARYAALAERALADLDGWIASMRDPAASSGARAPASAAALVGE